MGSLEAPISSRGPSGGTGRTSTLLDAYRTRPQQQRTPEDSVEVTLVADCLKDLLEHELSPIEAQVLSLRYGLKDGAALSWKQIAARVEMPEKQAQLAQSRALRKLRKQRSLRQCAAPSYLGPARTRNHERYTAASECRTSEHERQTPNACGLWISTLETPHAPFERTLPCPPNGARLQPFCDHEDWEHDALGAMSPGGGRR